MDKSKAIELLKQVLSKVTQLRTLRYDDQKFELWCDKIKNILEAAFGMDSWEYRRFAQAVIQYWGRSDAELQEAYNSYLDSYETALKSIIQKYELLGIEEEPAATAEPKDSVDLPIYLFNKMQLHPRVIEVSKSLFETGHYTQAIFEAFKAVNNSVKEKSRLQNLDGKQLMAQAFNEQSPRIRLN